MLAREDALHPALDVAEEAPDPAAAAPGAFFHTFPGGASGGPAGSLTTFPMDDDLRDRTRTMASASGSLSDARSLSSTLWSFVGVVLAALGPRAIPRGLVASALALGEEEETFFCSEANGGGYYEAAGAAAAKEGGSSSAGVAAGPRASASGSGRALACASRRRGSGPPRDAECCVPAGGAGEDDDPRDRRRACSIEPRRLRAAARVRVRSRGCAPRSRRRSRRGHRGGPDATPDDAADAAGAAAAGRRRRRRTAGRRRRRGRDDDDDERDPDPFEEDDAAWAARVEARLLEGHARLFSARMFSARFVSARLFSPGFSDGPPLGGLSDAGEEVVRNARAAEARLAIVDFVASGTATARRHWAFLTASESSGAEARTGPRDVTLDDVYPDDVYPDDPRDDFFRDDARVAANGPNAAVFVEALRLFAPGNASNASNPSSGESARTQWVPNHAGRAS